jgi:hypothetical protein
VGDDEGVGVFGLDAVDGVAGELDVDVAVAFPEVHFAAGLFDDPCAEVFIGDEEDGSIGGGLVDDLDGVAGGDDDVAEGFDGAGAVDVGDDEVVFLGVGLEEGFELGGGAGLFEGASGVGIREDDDFVRVYDFGGFGHEVDAAEDDDIGIGGFGVVGEAEGVSDVIGDVLDVTGLVVVGEDDGVSRFFEGEDFFLEVECGGHGGRVSGLDHFDGSDVFGAGFDDE